ncbi:MAG: hypothetical protein J0L52_08305 [Caulobacterales bacterium]|nr:hypothetical protein [Caulobacterales bacterium]
MHAQERTLSDAEVLTLADGQTIWCENWNDRSRDCESLYTLRREADGRLVLAGMFLLAEAPAILITLADVVTLEHGRLCSSGNTDELVIQARVAGVPSVEMSEAFRAVLAESMAEYRTSTICQQFLSMGDPEMMGEIVTADDQRLYHFESTYRLGTADSGFLLRTQVADQPEQMMTDL